jgi:hypothetical protein
MLAPPSNLRPRSLPELLDAGVGLYRDNFAHFLAVAAVINLPLGLLTAILSSVLFIGRSSSFQGLFLDADTLSRGALIGAALAVAGVSLLSALAGTFALAALLCSLQARLAGERPGIVAAYRAGLSRVPSLIGTRILFYLGTFAGFLPAALAFLLGGFMVAGDGAGAQAGGVIAILAGVVLLALGFGFLVWLWVRWRFHSQTCVLEGRNPVRSLQRSQAVVTGSWWRTFFFLVLKYLLIAAVSSTPQALVSIPILIFAGPFAQTQFWPSLISNAVNILTSILLLPLDVIAATMLYYDYRVRREALDLEVGVAALEREAGIPA